MGRAVRPRKPDRDGRCTRRTEGIAFGGVALAAPFDIADNGTLVYNPESAAQARSLVWVDRQGREETIPAPPRAYDIARLSPDGAAVALQVSDQEQDIWILNLVRRTLTRFTFDKARDRAPQWTPDGRRILFESERDGRGNLWWQATDGTGKPETLAEGTTLLPSGVAPDGSVALFWGAPPDISAVTLDGAKRVQALVRTEYAERNATISPDGRWIAYEANASGGSEIYVRPYPDLSAAQWQVSTNGGSRPVWAHSGRELFYLAENSLMHVPVEPGTTWRAGVPTELFSAPYVGGGVVSTWYDVSLDDRRFLMIKEGTAQGTSGPSLIVIENWTAELKKLAK